MDVQTLKPGSRTARLRKVLGNRFDSVESAMAATVTLIGLLAMCGAFGALLVRAIAQLAH